MVFFMPKARVVIFANGFLSDPVAARRLLQPEDVLYAADAGASHILRMGLLPALVVGDLDSLPEEDLQKLRADGVRMVQHPQDKALTDLELTINSALEEGHRSFLIVAALGGRLDMTLSNLSLLTRPDLLNLDVRLDDGMEQVLFVRGETHISGHAGDIISLVAWGGPVEQVTTSGLRWPLSDDRLESYETRTISNEMQVAEAVIRIGSGLLLCIHRRRSPPGIS
ncbi:MAG TPA: thiamine diphosphokinase [Anaerolineae bacterium]|nr:thiamine diphosphokinase [Anaerolineae bacterium]HCM97181.1 thiamine diphosphokinase [Anaerolineae bacterium]